jgi:hypothetical protein
MAVGTVYYCPELRLYRFTMKGETTDENDVDYKFDEDELIIAIATHMESGEQGQADFMSKVTGLGRVNPHKVIMFTDASDQIQIVEPADYWKKVEKEAKDSEKSEKTEDSGG